MQVVEFPVFAIGATKHGYLFSDQFPLSVSDGGVGFVFDKDGGLAVEGLTGKGGTKGNAIQLGEDFAFPVIWVFGSGDIEQSRKDVDQLGGFSVPIFVPAGDTFGPVKEEGGGRAAFMSEMFV